jgi:protein O-mannosyl-transferase
MPELPPRRRRLFILLLAFTAYFPILKLPFLWDDHTMIEANAHLRSWSAANLRHDFTADVFDGHGDPYYRPAQTLTNRIDYTIWGLHPFGYHLTNLAAHTLNALLLEELILLLGFPVLTAFLCASLFAVSPIGVEQLMIIAGRAELFGLTFSLLTLILLLKAPRSTLSLASAYFSFAVSLLFKESAVITPALAALLFAWQRRSRRDYVALLGFLALLIPYWFLRRHAVGPALEGLSLKWLMLFFFKAFPIVLWHYAGLVLWPWNLHSHHVMTHIQSFWIFQWAILIALLYFSFRRKERWIWLALGWFVLMLVPKVPIMIIGHFMLDHWAYPASVGVFLPLAIFFNYGWTHPSEKWIHRISLFYFVLLIGYALLVRLNIELRGSDEKMYRWALNFTSSNPIKHNLGLYLIEHGRPLEGIPLLEEVRGAYPNDAENTYELAKAYFMTGHPKTAVWLLKTIVKAHPDFTLAQETLKHIKPQ